MTKACLNCRTQSGQASEPGKAHLVQQHPPPTRNFLHPMKILASNVLASAVLFLVPYAAMAAEEWELTYSDTDTWGTDESLFEINGKGTNDVLARAQHSGGSGYTRGWSYVEHQGVADSDEISGNESESDIFVQGVATVDDSTPSATWTASEGFGITVDSDSGSTTEDEVNQFARSAGKVEYTISSNEPSWDIGSGSSFFSLYSEVSYSLKAVAKLESGTSGWAEGSLLGESAGDGVTATVVWDEF